MRSPRPRFTSPPPASPTTSPAPPELIVAPCGSTAVLAVLGLVVCVGGVGGCRFPVDSGGEGEGAAGEGAEGEGAGGEGEGGGGEGEGVAGEGEGGAGEGEGEGAGVDPPFGESSHGGGGPAQGGAAQTSDGVDYIIVMPQSATSPTPVMIVYSGVEGGAQMAANLGNAGPFEGLGDVLFAVIDGAVHFGDGAAGSSVLDDVRAKYDVDNDRTYLFSESAGTSAGLALGFTLRESAFAAYWVNDVNATASPSSNAAALGFAPFGNAGPGGDFNDANTIVSAMRTAGYRVEDPAPYDGAGSGTHGDSDQFLAALAWFVGRSRR